MLESKNKAFASVINDWKKQDSNKGQFINLQEGNMYDTIKSVINYSWDIKLWEYLTVSFFMLMIGLALGKQK